ncbi:MAG: D-cysteine desulfhydrase family protein, partial [Deltaproteobacteria bacterium]|nr:D-cysteine desulfhydrase family protein [Deltaproteobacteria bacterium]
MPDKLNLGRLPTPIQPLPKLSNTVSKFGEVNLFVKRDDLSHGPAAGNKIRKLEFLFADARRRSAKTVVTCGSEQSNHARATAILARELGFECALFLKKASEGVPPIEGNLLLDHMCGATVNIISAAEYDDIARVYRSAQELYRKRDGKLPYLIPEGGSNDIGALGYCAAFEEIASQTAKNGLPARFDSIITANGSGGTHAGLLLGRNLAGCDDGCEIVTFNVLRTAEEMSERVKKIMIAAIQNQRMPISFMPADIHVIDGYVAPGYARANPELYDFIVRVAREDGLLLDATYTGKALYGLVTELTASPERAKRFGKNVLFIHTGGLPSLFAHTAG